MSIVESSIAIAERATESVLHAQVTPFRYFLQNGHEGLDYSHLHYSTMAFTIKNFIIKLMRLRPSSASTQPVPPELLDIIIAHLVDDKVSLLSCALVHPSWAGFSRYYLRDLNLVVSTPSRANELTKLLGSSREMLSASITSITLASDAPVAISRRGKFLRARPYRKLLYVLKAKGVMLRSGAVEKDTSLVRLLAQYFPDLTAFRVSSGSYQNLPNVIHALYGCFPRLAELCIEHGLCGMDIPDARLFGLQNFRLYMPSLRTLRVVGWNNDLVHWLGNNIVGTLERLVLESSSMRSTCCIGEASLLIQRNMDTLKDLRLTFVRRNGSWFFRFIFVAMCSCFLFIVTFDLSGLVHLENLEVTSGMGETELALYGWRLPRSLKRVYLRDVVSVLRVHCPVCDRVGDKKSFPGWESAGRAGDST